MLVLDEPTVFLPEHEKVFLYDLIRRVAADGTGVLFVSHDMTSVREISRPGGRAAGRTEGRRRPDGQDQRRRSWWSSSPGTGSPAPDRLEPRGRIAVRLAPDARSRCRSRGSRVAACATSSSSCAPGRSSASPDCSGRAARTFRTRCSARCPVPRASCAAGPSAASVGQLSPRRAQRIGMALVPGDRKQQGAAAELSVATNMMSLVLPRFLRHGVLSHRGIRRVGGGALRDLRHPAAGTSRRFERAERRQPAEGGARAVARARAARSAPARADAGGGRRHARTRSTSSCALAARTGPAVLWVSTDFDELATVCDRILVCAGGVIAGEVPGPPYHPRPDHERGLHRRIPRHEGGGEFERMTVDLENERAPPATRRARRSRPAARGWSDTAACWRASCCRSRSPR